MALRLGIDRCVMTVLGKLRWPLTLYPLYVPYIHTETLPKVLHLLSVSPGVSLSREMVSQQLPLSGGGAGQVSQWGWRGGGQVSDECQC